MDDALREAGIGLRDAGLVARRLRPIVAATSPSVSANRFATTRTVVTDVRNPTAITT